MKKMFILIFLGFAFSKKAVSQDCALKLVDVAKFCKDGKFDDALKVCDTILEVCKLEDEICGYASKIKGIIYFDKNDYPNAIKFFLKALNSNKIYGGEDCQEYTNNLSNLANAYQNNSDYQNAEIFYLKALEKSRKARKSFPTNYSNILNKVGNFYGDKGELVKAINLQNENLTLIDSLVGKNNLDFVFTLGCLAILYDANGNFINSEKSFLECFRIRKLLNTTNNPTYTKQVEVEYAGLLNGLASMYSHKGDFVNAKYYYELALESYRKNKGIESLDYSIILDNLAVVYLNLSNYFIAESCIQQSLKIKEKILGKNSLEFSASLCNLASFYTNTGDFDKALKFYKESEGITKKLIGSENLQYATTLNNIGDLYLQIHNYKDAESYLLESLKIRKNLLGIKHNSYAESLGALAALYLKIGLVEKAKILFLEEMSIIENLFGENDYRLIYINEFLAEINFELNKNESANIYYSKAIDLSIKNFGQFHSNTAEVIGNYNTYLLKDGDENLLYKNSCIIFNIKFRDLRYSTIYMSENQLQKFNKKQMGSFNFLYSILNTNIYPSLADSLINSNYFIKGALLQNNIRLSESAKNSKDTSVLNRWEEYKNLKSQITTLSQLPLSKQIDLQPLKDDAEKLEKELMQALPAFQEQTINNNIKWQQVQAKLKDNEAAIEFVHFQYYNKRWTDTTFYAAYIVKKGIKHPIFINCFQEKDLIAILEKSKLKTDINNLYQGIDNKLYQLIWQPLDSVLQNINTVYVSPSGLLNRISFGAITAPSNKKLLEQYQIHIMNNTRAIAELKPNLPAIASIALLGDIDYDNEPSTIHNNNSEIATIDDSTLVTLRNNMGSKWQYLFGTKKEIESVKLITIGSNINITLYGGSNASEDLVKAMGTGKQTVPNIIHFATHGFAMPNPQVKNTKREFDFSDDKNKFKYAIDPLSRTGIILSGANKVWTTNNTFANKEDGILTASEIADLNLSNCQLAVLSACETGLGDVQGSEGVYGLQRAFKMAGVRYIINSLWQIPDAETSEFMQLFYTNYLQNKMEIHKAFTETQLAMNVKYEPYKWAAFVLVE
jgi:CHAT domain-containing protein